MKKDNTVEMIIRAMDNLADAIRCHAKVSDQYREDVNRRTAERDAKAQRKSQQLWTDLIEENERDDARHNRGGERQ